jgi:fructokinase
MALYGSIEGGGTKFVCAVGSTPDNLRAEVRFPTTTPDETLERTIEFFTGRGPLDAIGIAMFGPLNLDRESADYGRVGPTPKPGWTNADIVGPLSEAFRIPVGFDTDVNGAALGEGRWGAGAGLDNFVYVTVGTGIGGGVVANGKAVHGLVHPEVGHLRIPRHPEDTYPGRCPFHGDCLEGVASGPAIADRWGTSAQDLGADTPRAVELEAFSLGYALANLALVLSPERIIIGGGVMQLPGLLQATRRRMLEALGGYVDSPALERGACAYVVAPKLGGGSGIAGGLVLAERAAFLIE